MAVPGRLSTEVRIQSPAAKFYNLFASQLHQIPNIAERVHKITLHQGDWHTIGSVKQWTYVIDGKVTTCKESIEAIDERNMKITFSLFEGDISHQYRIFKFIFQVIDKGDGSATVKWTFEYEKINDNVKPPHGYIDYVTKVTKDIDGHLLRA